MNIKNITLKSLILLTAVFIAVNAAAAPSRGGATSLNFLHMDAGARYLGMGGVGASLGHDMTGAYYNPAIAGQFDTVSLTASGGKMSWDMKNYFVGASVPLQFFSLTGDKPLILGVSGFFSDLGEDYDWRNSGGIKRDFGKDMSLAVTLSEEIFSHDWDLNTGATLTVKHMFGVSGKYISSSLPDPDSTSGDIDADTFAFDLGYLISVPEIGLGLGASVLNIGKKIKYIDEEEELPLTVKAGVSFYLIDIDNFRLTAAGDYIRYMEEEENRVRAGLEMTVFEVLNIRGGYRFMEEENDNFTLGFGLQLFGLSVDYGMMFNPMFGGDVNQLSVSYRFPGKSAKKETYKETKAKEPPPAPRNPNPIIY